MNRAIWRDAALATKERAPWSRAPAIVARSIRLIASVAPGRLGLTVGLQLLTATGLGALILQTRSAARIILEAAAVGEDLARVLVALVPLAAIAVAVTLLRSLQALAQNELGRIFSDAIAARMVRVSAGVELAAYDDQEFFDRMSRAQQGTGMSAVSSSLSAIGSGLSVVGVALALAAVSSVLVGLVALAAIPAAVIQASNAAKQYDLSVELVGKMRIGGYLRRLLSDREPAKEVRAFKLGPELIRRFEANQDDVRRRNFHLTRRNEVRSLLADGAGWLVTAGGYAFVILLLVNGDLDLPDATVAVVALQQARNLWAQTLGHLSRAMTQAFPLDDLLWFLDIPQPALASEDRLDPFERIEFDDVAFAYPGSDDLVLDGISLQINRGDVIALVGENGSGKTTLAKLLNRLYEPTSGRILWDGTDLATVDQSAVSEHIATVFQDFQRYGFSARDNVSLGRIERGPEGVEEAVDAAGARFLHDLDEGLDTMLGRMFGGTDLSIGQWQRVAIARAFHRDAPLLILDEPTAALDPRAEHDLFEKVRDLFAGRTVVLISHRYSTVTNADRIIVLDKGRIVEQGSHRELLAQDGLYAELFNLQAAAYRDEPTTPPTRRSDGSSDLAR